jgi:hypothetical protein
MIEIPDSLPYPKILKFPEVPELAERFVYVIKAYPLDGFSFVISRGDGHVCIRVADWSGRVLTAEECEKQPLVQKVMKEYNPRCEHFMKIAAISKLQFYYSNNGLLVDVRLGEAKFCGPGYISDFFGRLGIPIQERVGDPVVVKQEFLDKVNTQLDPYKYDTYVLKSSAFKPMIRGDLVLPLYGILEREIKQPT